MVTMDFSNAFSHVGIMFAIIIWKPKDMYERSWSNACDHWFM